MSPLLGPLQFEAQSFSLFLAMSLVSAAFATCAHGFLIFKNPWRLLRPAFVLAILLTIFFQWPSVFLADAIREGLGYPWLFWASIHIVPIALIVWIIVTSKLDIAKNTTSKPNYSPTILIVPIFLLILLSFLYLQRVPFSCTALFAIIYDPPYTLLARELSIKFSGSIIASYSFGALANTVAPFVIALSIPLAIRSFSFKKAHSLIFFSLLITLAILLVLLSGSKGLLIPSMIFVIGSALVWNRTMLEKFLYSVIAFFILIGGLIAFELIKERSPSKEKHYQFGACVVHLDACAAVAPLISSMKSREGALGLSLAQVEKLDDQRVEACSAAGKKSAVPEREFWTEKRSYNQLSRVYDYAFAIAERALITPIRVASWYFLYVAEHGHPGMAAMPLGARRFAGYTVNMPVKVYQEYGVVFSGGDATSSSTAPTSFVYAYPASLGRIGIPLVIFLVVFLDVLYMIFVRRLPANLLGLAGGVGLVISLNMIMSDFITVLETHGGIVAIALLAFFAMAYRNPKGYEFN